MPADVSPHETDRAESVDLLIVGSGPVGSTFARRVFDAVPAAKILMIDAGPALTDPPGVNLKNLVDLDLRDRLQVASQGPEAHSYGLSSLQDRARTRNSSNGSPATLARPGTHLVTPADQDAEMGAAAMSTNVGGMGAHWTCACPWPAGSERIPFLNDEVWSKELTAAQSLLAVTQDAYPSTARSAAIVNSLQKVFGDRAAAPRQVQPMPLAVQVESDGERRWTGADTILGSLTTAPADRFELRPSTLAARLLVDGDAVTGAELVDRTTGHRYVVAARVVVVAADAFRTPQLLWASGIRTAALGHYLNDHLQVMGAVALNETDSAAPATAGGSTVDPVAGVFWVPFSDAHPVHGQVMHMDLSPLPMEAEAARAPDQHVVGMGWLCPKDIKFDDVVEFDDSAADAFGMPRMKVHYRWTEVDIATMDAAEQEIREAATVLGPFVSEPARMPPGSSLHYQGTVRMGVDPADSVCDDDAQVWGVTNLYLGGNGVIPTATAGNSTLTSVALAVHASRAIAAQLTSLMTASSSR